MKRITATAQDEGARLDHVLERLAPDMGLRGRRRFCELGLVLVNGRPAAAARKVREGDSIELQDEQAPQSTQALPGADAPRLVARTAAFAFLYKPAAMHTESLAGKPGESLQDVVESLAGGKARLLNRLDFATSGLAAAALNRAGEEAYHSAQDRGLTEKRYLALLEGALTRPVLADRRLLLKNRSRVLVELDRHPDVRRHTRITPLAVMPAAPLWEKLGLTCPAKGPEQLTLAGCVILKGARHQIRAHCASCGFPLAGDARYGAQSRAAGDTERFFLHHGRLILPEAEALCLPPWLDELGEDAAYRARRWLEA